MKSEVYFLAKAALILTVVDAFIPRAETYVKTHAKANHEHEYPRKSDHNGASYHSYPPHYPQPNHYPYPTEIKMGLLDLNPFHGGGSGASKQALDEQWEIQQAILRERRGHKEDKTRTKNTKGGEAGSKNVEIVGAKKFVKVVEHASDTEHEPKKSLADMFFGVKKFERD
jgi:hypothetical protein